MHHFRKMGWAIQTDIWRILEGPDCLTLLPTDRQTNRLHGAETFLRSCQLSSYSRTSQHFMEPEHSLSCSQEPSTGPYP
jgi:hypothetical protein